MESRVSRSTVKRWLKEWDYIVNGGMPSEDHVAGNSSCKPVDGITSRQLTKIMLEQAYEALPPYLKRVAYYRWVKPKAFRKTLAQLGCTKDQYYYRCDKAVTFIFHYVNGETFVV